MWQWLYIPIDLNAISASLLGCMVLAVGIAIGIGIGKDMQWKQDLWFFKQPGAKRPWWI